MAQARDKAYRYRFYPTEDQKQALAKTFGCCRWIYNHFLGLKSTAWKEENKNLKYGDCASILTTQKSQHAWLKEVSSVPLQQSLRHLDKAFDRFFKGKSQYPSFKKRHYQQSASYMKNAFTYKEGEITLAKQKESLNIRWSRRFCGNPSSLTVTRDSAERYYISITVKEEISSLPFVKKEIGLDLELTNAFKDHEGNTVSSPKFLEKGLKQLRQKQKSLSRKVQGSKNYGKAKKKVARLHARIRDKRHDVFHKLSWQIVNENQVIAIETLSVNLLSSFQDS